MSRALMIVMAVAISLSCIKSPAPAEEAQREDGPADSAATEHAVVVKFKYGRENLKELYVAGDRLKTEIKKAGAGEYDGHEIAVDLSEGTYFMYGRDADRLFSVIRPTLESIPFLAGATVVLRYGPPEVGVREKTLTVGPRP